VPVALGVAALILLIITLIRIKNRKVVHVYDKIGKVGYMQPLNSV